MLYSVGDVSRFNLRDFVADLVADLSVSADPERLALEVEVEPIAVSASKAAPLALNSNRRNPSATSGRCCEASAVTYNPFPPQPDETR